MARRWFRSWRDDAPAPVPEVTPASEIPALRDALGGLVRRVNAAAGRLPDGAVPAVRDIEDHLVALLDHADERLQAGVSVDTLAMVTLAATINDYLPTSIDVYLALPEAFLVEHRNPQGQTAAEELSAQLELLEQGVAELASALYSGDAQRLFAQGRFLDAKFAKTDLDL